MSILMTIALSIFGVDLAERAATRARAQTAADAAALATIAESGPYGSAVPRSAAARYAALNDATVVECRCEPGATAVQVSVVVDGVEARARAVIEPDAIGPATGVAAIDGLHPSLERAVASLVSESGGSIHVVSGFRSPQEQAALWASALQRYGSAEAADDWVAPPGHSMHERGLAVDLGGDLQEAERLVSTLGLPLHAPLANEPWHFELIGTR
jgi:hypothetical protein